MASIVAELYLLADMLPACAVANMLRCALQAGCQHVAPAGKWSNNEIIAVKAFDSKWKWKKLHKLGAHWGKLKANKYKWYPTYWERKW